MSYKYIYIDIPRKLYNKMIYEVGAVGIEIRITESINFLISKRRTELTLLPIPTCENPVSLELEISDQLHARILKQTNRYGITEEQLSMIAIQRLAHPEKWWG